MIYGTIKFLVKSLLIFILFTITLVILFRWINPSITSFIHIKSFNNFSSIIETGNFRQEWVPLNKISKNLVLAVIASEDQRFFDHLGFDLKEIEKAIESNNRRNRQRGASTITQQTVKNLFLWPNKSFIRKGLEVYFTVLVELLWGKKRIIEVYLNMAEMGRGIYGAEAASVHFFNKPASFLSESNAALLAAVLPNPLKYSAKTPSNYLMIRRNNIITNMRRLGGTAFLGEIYN